MKTTGALALSLALVMTVPAMGSAQTGMSHQRHQGQQQMMGQMQDMGQMMQQMAAMHEQLRGLQDRMGSMMQMGVPAHDMQHQQMRDMMGAMTETAGQMHMAMSRMAEMAGNPAMTADMHQDLQELQSHMQRMTEGMAAGIEVMKRLQDRMSGSHGGTR